MLFIDLAVRQQHRLIEILIIARRGVKVGHDDFGQIDAPPAFVVVRHRAGTAIGLVQFIRRIDQRRLDQRRRGHRVGVRSLVILHEHRRRARRVRTGHARAAYVNVEIINRRPGNRGLVRCGGRRGGGDPASRCNQVRLDAPVRARPATGEIAHRVRTVGIKSVGQRQCARNILRSARGDDVFGGGRAVHRLRVRARVTSGEFQNVRLVACCAGVRVPHQLIELRRVNVVIALHVIAPTV